MSKQIKWSQWDKSDGMVGCGFNEYNTLMQWMRELGKDAKNCIKHYDAKHAVYGRKIFNESDELDEIRFYCNAYVSDDELEEIVTNHPHDLFFVVHK